MLSHPPINVNNINLDQARIIDFETGKEQKFTIRVEITPSVGQQAANPLWCIVWRGDPLIEIAAYKSNNKQEYNFEDFPPPIYVTHWEQVGDTMNQLNLNN